MRTSSLHTLLAGLALLSLVACSNGVTSTADLVAVSVQPKLHELGINDTLALQATVTGTDDPAVAWSVLEVGGGTVDAQGNYTAPAMGGTYHVEARALAASGKHDTSEITVKGPITLSPAAVALETGKSTAFTATVRRNGDTAVIWSVLEAGGGSVSDLGLYTAPATPGTYHVKAISHADVRQSATATVTVTAPVPVAVTVTPGTASLTFGQSIGFTARVTGSTDTEVSWTVTESGGGTVNASGVYAAPSQAGTYHVVATAHVDGATSATATVAVAAAPVVAVTVSPEALSIRSDETTTFTAAVTNAADGSVTWSVAEAGGGTVTQAGVYHPPTTLGIYHVVATSNANPTRSSFATVGVKAPAAVAVAVNPTAVSLTAGQVFTLAASVTNTSDTAVTWSVSEAGGGSVTAAGVYTAPSTIGTYHVVATSHADGSKTASCAVTVTAAPVVSVVVSPASATVAAGRTATFSASVVNAANGAVTWTVAEAGGGSVTGGGVYTAPVAGGTFHVVATSVADGSKSASATVVVTPPVSVAISPTSLSLTPGQSQAFSATVSNAADGSVSWSVTEAGGGTIGGAGVYTAPATAGVYHVVARSNADATKSASGLVTVSAAPVVGITIAPRSASLIAGQSANFTAAVTNSADGAVSWSVAEAGGGLVTSGGVYTAPATPGTYHVVATAHADATKSDQASVTVTAAPVVSVSLTPTTASLTAGQSTTFGATVQNASNTTVTWTVTEAGGGSISSAGVYTAPAAAGTYHVVATSNQDASKSATATVTVQAAPAIGITVSPRTAALTVNQTTSFAAVVTNTGDTTAVWSVVEAGGGTVTSGGVYTAPATPGTYHVRAAAQADAGKTDQATVTVAAAPVVSVSLTPTSATVSVGQGAAFTATVVNASNTTVSWSVTEAGGGSVTSGGVYTAPATAGTYHLVATSNQDASKSATAIVTVLASSGSLADQLAALSTRAISFGHQSVGGNILTGLQTLLDANAGAEPTLVLGRTAADIATGRLTQWWVGTNEYPYGKIADFAGAMAVQGAALSSRRGIAFMKYCFVDFYDSAKDISWPANETAAAQALFNQYKTTLATLKATYPGVTFVHFTAPLVHTDQVAFQSNARREYYNGLLRAAYAGKEPVFDLATVESTRADGSRCTNTNASAGAIGTPTLCAEYGVSGDDGHLNDTAKGIVARALVAYLAALP